MEANKDLIFELPSYETKPEWCKAWLSIKEAALMLERAGYGQYKTHTLYKLIKEGKHPFQGKRWGGHYYFEKASIEAFTNQTLIPFEDAER